MKRNRIRRGFTLAEMLIAVLLLGFVSAMVAVMTTAILSSTNAMAETAQAEVLGSEILENLARELRFGHQISVLKETENEDGTLKTEEVDEGQEGVRVTYLRSADDEHTRYTLYLGTEEDGHPGKIVAQYYEKGFESRDLLFGGVSYGENLSVSALTFKKEESKVTISIQIVYGENELYNGNISVAPLNAFKEETKSEETQS